VISKILAWKKVEIRKKKLLNLKIPPVKTWPIQWP
jgi:hypothetical protein